MPTPTQIEVSVDNTEYCRYEEDLNTITATIVASGGGSYSGETITVQLRKARRSRDAVVASSVVELNSLEDRIVSVVTFPLNDIVDADMISLVRHGKYFVHAEVTGDDTVYGVSPDFDVRVVSLEKLKRDFLFGLDLRATELKQLRYQPTQITGVRISEVSKSHPEGFGQLSYSYHVDGSNTIRSLSWNGGPSVFVSAPGTYLLQNGGATPALPLPIPSTQPQYIEVKVASVALLPTVSITESVLIERMRMDDKALAGFLDNAIKWLEEQELCVYIEPTNVVSEVDPTTVQYTTGVANPRPIMTDADYDFVKSPLTYFIPAGGYPGWVYIQTPFMSILRVDSLYGAIASTRVIDVDLEWIEHSTEGGLIQLVPFNTEVAFDFLGLIWVNSIHGATELPNFWRYNMIVGLREASADIRNMIAKKAAIDALTLAGQAIRPGVGSLSLGRDGVSQSVSFINQQQYGMFNAAIQRYSDEIQDVMPKLRARYRGATLTVV